MKKIKGLYENKKVSNGLIRVGLIGAGKWGKNYMPLIEKHAETKLVRIFKKGVWFKFDIHIPDGVDISSNSYELTQNLDIDAVIIATPQRTHYAIAKDALMFNKHVLIEKPFTCNAEEAKELIELAKEKNKILMTGHLYLYHPAIRRIKGMIDSGYLGDIQKISSKRMGMYDRKNALWEMGSHDLYIMEYLLDTKPKIVSNTGITWHQTILLNYDNIPVLLETSTNYNGKIREIRIEGSKKYCMFDDTKNKLVIIDKETKNKYPIKIDSDLPLTLLYDSFIYHILEGTQPKFNGGEMGLSNIETLQMIDNA